MRAAKIIWLFSLATLVGIFTGIAWLMSLSYDNVIQFAIDQLQRPELQSALEQNYFTQNKFERLQRGGLSFLFIILGLIGFLILQRKNFFNHTHSLLQSVKNGILVIIRDLKNTQGSIKYLLVAVLLLVFVRSVYYAYTMYPQYDECWNYNYFLSNNFFTTFFAYNNYPLHNIITYAFLSVWPDNTFCMRLPNILIGLLTLVLVFVLIKKIFRSDVLALAASAIFSVLPTVFFYLLFARGVMLALFFAVLLSFYFFIKKIEHWSKADLTLVILLCGLGCYSMISFPIFIVSICGLILIETLLSKNYKASKNILIAGIGGAVLSLLFYTPILLGSGMHIVFDSGYLSGQRTFSTLLRNTQYLSRQQIGFHHGIYFFLLINVFLLFKSPQKRILYFNIIVLLIPYLLFVLFDTYLPARALGFQALAYLFSICSVLHYLRENTALLSAASLILVGIFSYISSQHPFFSWSERKDKGAYDMAQALLEKNCTQLYDRLGNFSYFIPGIQYHYKLQGKEIKFYTNNKKSVRYKHPQKFASNFWVIDGNKLKNKIGKDIFFTYKDEANHYILYEKNQKKNTK